MALTYTLAAVAALLIFEGGAQMSDSIRALRHPVYRDPPTDFTMLAIAVVCIFLGCAIAAAVLGFDNPLPLLVD